MIAELRLYKKLPTFFVVYSSDKYNVHNEYYLQFPFTALLTLPPFVICCLWAAMIDVFPSSGAVVLGSEVIQTMATLMLALIMYILMAPNSPIMASVSRHDVHQGTKINSLLLIDQQLR